MELNKNEQLACPVCITPLISADNKQCSKCGIYAHTTCGNTHIVKPSLGLGLWGSKFNDDPQQEKEIFTCHKCKHETSQNDSINSLHSENKRMLEKLDNANKQIHSLSISLKNNKQQLDLAIQELDKRSKPVIAVSWVYIGLFIFVTIITALLIWKGWAKSPEVSIQYNVGEIIGGILAGVGAATAGIAYAIKQLKYDEDRRG